jgi:thymidylate synthase (FAD)
MKVQLIAKTVGLEEYAGKSIDEIIVGQARLSSGKIGEELFNKPEKLLRHCLMNGHWSVFAMANLSFEITTSRAMGRELLRHWSIRPQEFSQRYAAPSGSEPIELRAQAENNRQSSSTVIDSPKLKAVVDSTLENVFDCYQFLLENGVARETARLILPESTQTKLCMNGSIREWITMLNLRLHHTAQKECREIAHEIRDAVIRECPIIAAALFNFEGAEEMHILDRMVLEKYGVYYHAINLQQEKTK